MNDPVHTDFSIRPMLPEDLPAARVIWENTEGVGLNEDETPQLLTAYLLRNPDISCVAAGSGGHVVAALLGGHDGRRGYLYHLAVSPDHRGKGIARAIVAHTLSALAKAGIVRASIMVYADNESGRNFWYQLGWHGREDLDLMQSATAPCQ